MTPPRCIISHCGGHGCTAHCRTWWCRSRWCCRAAGRGCLIAGGVVSRRWLAALHTPRGSLCPKAASVQRRGLTVTAWRLAKSTGGRRRAAALAAAEGSDDAQGLALIQGEALRCGARSERERGPGLRRGTALPFHRLPYMLAPQADRHCHRQLSIAKLCTQLHHAEPGAGGMANAKRTW